MKCKHCGKEIEKQNGKWKHKITDRMYWVSCDLSAEPEEGK